MNATDLQLIKSLEADEQFFVETMLRIDPQIEYQQSSRLPRVRSALHDSGWTTQRIKSTLNRLIALERLYVSRSGKSCSMLNCFKQRHQTNRLGICVYCNQRSNNLTRDHVIPKSKGGTDDLRNIALACAVCNHSKRDRTPTRWAIDILIFALKHKCDSLIALLKGAVGRQFWFGVNESYGRCGKDNSHVQR